jgi:glycine/D-amino acid oxidase-like deaminating enzyme
LRIHPSEFIERPKQALKTDVLVIGGGAAGLAAACAAKAGARVLLLEKYGFCGAAAVAGLSGAVCGLFAATNNRAAVPERVVFGFADRFLDLTKTRGGVAAIARTVASCGSSSARSFRSIRSSSRLISSNARDRKRPGFSLQPDRRAFA